MEENFIPCKESIILNELGFDRACLGWYETDKSALSVGESWRSGQYSIKAPLYQQAFKWFREKYNFDLNWKPISMVGITCYYDIEIHHPKYVWDKPPKVTGKTYEEVELECLKKLIEIVKNK